MVHMIIGRLAMTHFNHWYTKIIKYQIEKFHYLRGTLKDNAAKVILQLEISAMNYQSAWSLLEKRYKNKSLMVHNHIKGIVGDWYPKIVRQSMSD